MPITATAERIPGLPEGARLLPRTARAITGLELVEMLVVHLERMLAQLGEPDAGFVARAATKLQGYKSINQVHLTFPKVSWKLTVSKELYSSGDSNHRAILSLQLDARLHLVIEFGTTLEGVPSEVVSLSEVQAREPAPDTLRLKFGLAFKVPVEMPDGRHLLVEVQKSAPPSFNPPLVPTMIEAPEPVEPAKQIQFDEQTVLGQVPEPEESLKAVITGKPGRPRRVK